MTAIAFTMMAIAGDRFFAIVFPFKARITQSKVKVVLAFVWLCAISISIPPLVFYKYFERRWKDYTETFCTDIWPVSDFIKPSLFFFFKFYSKFTIKSLHQFVVETMTK